jgi:hypothetical protein
MQVSRRSNIAAGPPDHHREFVLARLQKAQCYPGRVNFPRQLAAGMILAKSALGDFTK